MTETKEASMIKYNQKQLNFNLIYPIHYVPKQCILVPDSSYMDIFSRPLSVSRLDVLSVRNSSFFNVMAVILQQGPPTPRVVNQYQSEGHLT